MATIQRLWNNINIYFVWDLMGKFFELFLCNSWLLIAFISFAWVYNYMYLTTPNRRYRLGLVYLINTMNQKKKSNGLLNPFGTSLLPINEGGTSNSE